MRIPFKIAGPAALVLLALVRCVAPEGSGEGILENGSVEFRVDQSSPKMVLATIQEAIKADALDSLKGLCDPEGHHDSPCNTVCEIANDDMRYIDQFKNWFGNARSINEQYVNGDTTFLPVELAPGSTESRLVDLGMIQRGPRWYLICFHWKQPP